MRTNQEREHRRAEALATYLEPAFGVVPPGVPPTTGPGDDTGLRRSLSDYLVAHPTESEQLWAEYAEGAGRTRTPRIPRQRRAPEPRPTGARLQRPRRTARAVARGVSRVSSQIYNSSAAVFAVATAGAIGCYVVFEHEAAWRLPALRGFSVVLLTLLPGLLYLRFLRFRLGPICSEYVYNLHRLGVDRPGYLPEPPRASNFYAPWYDDGGPLYRNLPTSIYRVKFQTHYGRWPVSGQEIHRTNMGNVLSVYVCMAVMGVGWAAVIWHLAASGPSGRLDSALRFGFLGSYFFVLSMLTRRYFQNDLRPGAYLSAVVRIVTVLILVAAVDQVWSVQGISDKLPDASENATAFLVGVFPSTAMQLLRRATGKVTGLLRGGLEPPFPLSQLDGMDIWTEARLLEVGVEDVQQLATANIVDLCLATRIPTQRLVDWIDEGILLLHAGMPRQDNVSDPTVRSTFRELREIGVRSATDVLALRATIGLRLDDRSSWPSADDPALGALVTGSASGPGLLTRVAVISTALQKQPNLPLVQNWLAVGSAERRSRFGRRNGVPAT